jgi:hypothetical protein
MLGTGGIVPPPAGYWEAIQPVLEKYDILLIADEVVTGFGRLGTMFGSDHYGIKPDLITIAKGLTSAYAPLSGSIVSTRCGRCWSRAPTRTAPSAMAGPIRPIPSARRPASPTYRRRRERGLGLDLFGGSNRFTGAWYDRAPVIFCATATKEPFKINDFRRSLASLKRARFYAV